MNIVTREEKKFLISLEEFRNKSHYLDGLLIQDEHNGIDGYIIRSLYFDTLYDDDYFEKLEGVETRRKIRLRIYDPKHNFAMLEMKQKQGASQKKTRHRNHGRRDGEKPRNRDAERPQVQGTRIQGLFG